MAEVRIQDGETLENALKRFKRKVLQEDIIREVKRHAFYLKPGQKKRVKSALARKRNRKKQRTGASPVIQASIARRSGQPSVEIAAQHRIALAVPSVANYKIGLNSAAF